VYDVFKIKSAKSTVTPLLTLGGQNVKLVNHYKYLGIVLDTELSDDKDIQRQLQYQYCAAKKLVPNAIVKRSVCLFLSTCVVQSVCVCTTTSYLLANKFI